jgi:hypothetical protein
VETSIYKVKSSYAGSSVVRAQAALFAASLSRDFDIRLFDNLSPSRDLIFQHLRYLTGIHELWFESRGPQLSDN